MKTKKAPVGVGASLAGCHFGLVIQLQGKLDLARVVRSVASGADFAKVRIVEIGGSGDGLNAVAAESGSVKVGMIENVENLRTELETETFVDGDLLENGEVKAMEARPRNLSRTAAECGDTTIDERGADSGLGASRWLSESCGVSNPAKLPICVSVESQMGVLPANQEIVTAGPISCPVRARESDRLAALECGKPLNAPATNYLVCGATGIGHEVFALAKGQLIAAAKMEDITDVEVSEAVVVPDSGAGNVRSAITSKASAVQQITGIR